VTDGEDSLGDFDEPLSEDSETDPGEVPEPTVPSVEPPRPGSSASDTDEAESGPSLQEQYSQADPAFRQLFWKLVLLYKLGIIGLSLGTLVVLFDAHPTAGPVLLLGGVVFSIHALYLTRRGKARLDAGEFDMEGTQ
jgi:hypothetical protein